MKLRSLFEREVPNDATAWFETCISNFNPAALSMNNGRYDYDGLIYLRNVDDGEIKYPLGYVAGFTIVENEQLKSVKNFPTDTSHIECNQQEITVIDHPVVCDNDCSFFMNKITSLKNIHKFLKCKTLKLRANPIKDSILGLILVPGLENVVAGAASDSGEFIEAAKIINKYLGQGKPGVVKAHRELIDADLEAYAEL